MSLTSLTTGISDYATRRAIQQLASKLNYDASPTFAGLTISGEALSSALITQWSTAYSWGNHAGLYDTIGTASGEIDDHESTYDHSLLHSPVTLDALTGITLTGQQLSYTAGYAIPTTAKQAEWDSAYTHKTTEDAINGLVSCDGSGAYTAKVIGMDVQAYDADLTAIAALTPTDSNIIVGDGSTWVAESGATARTSLGLGTTDSPTFTNLALSTTSGTNFPTFYCADSSANYTPWFRNDGRSVEMTLDSFRDATGGSFLAMRHARGSVASPAILQNNDEVSSFFARAYDGVSAWRNAAGLVFVLTDTPTSGFSSPTSMRFYVSDGTTTSWQVAGAFHHSGRFGVGTVSPAEGIQCTSKIRADSAFNLNGTDGVSDSSAGVPTSLTLSGGIATAITRGGTAKFGDGGTTNYSEFEADGTLKFNGAATVWNDVNVGAMALALPVASQPDEVNFLDNTGADTGITTWGFAVGEKVSGAIDIPHDYKTGSNFTPHVHFQIIGAPAGGTDKAKWQIIYGKGRTGSTLAPATTITKELDVTTQYGFYRADFDAVAGTNWVLGDQFIFSLSRVAASSDEYAGDLLIATVGLHYECDTVGSRSITTK